MTVAAASCGNASRMLEIGVRNATERKSFGEPIAKFQLIQAVVADSYAEIYAWKCMLRDKTHARIAVSASQRKRLAPKCSEQKCAAV
jgi:acyl-CoA dehydrogenase